MDTLSLLMIIVPIILLILLIRILFGKHHSDDGSSISLDKEMARLRNGPHPDDYYLAEQRLVKIGETALPVLIGIVSDSTQPGDFRARALETAANIGGTKISELLIQCATDDPENYVRWNAIYQLGELHIKEALPLLKELAVSDDAKWSNPGAGFMSIKDAAIEAISAIESDQFEGHLDDPLKTLTSNEDTLFAGQLDDPIEALTSNVRLKDVDRRIKSDFPVEKHAEVVDVLSKCTSAHKATVYSIILDEADGDIDKLRESVKIANRVGDYRDLAQALISLRSK